MLEKMLKELNEIDNESNERGCKSCKYHDKHIYEKPCCFCINASKYKSKNEIEENKLMEARKFAIFMNNGDIITLDAMTFNWDDDGTLCFYGYNDDDDDSLIAIFKQDVLYGVSICNYEIHKEQLLLPKYEESETEE